MAKMSKAQAKRRLKEAQAKFKNVYINYDAVQQKSPVKTADMAAVEKIVERCLKRLG